MKMIRSIYKHHSLNMTSLVEYCYQWASIIGLYFQLMENYPKKQSVGVYFWQYGTASDCFLPIG